MGLDRKDSGAQKARVRFTGREGGGDHPKRGGPRPSRRTRRLHQWQWDSDGLLTGVVRASFSESERANDMFRALRTLDDVTSENARMLHSMLHRHESVLPVREYAVSMQSWWGVSGSEYLVAICQSGRVYRLGKPAFEQRLRGFAAKMIQTRARRLIACARCARLRAEVRTVVVTCDAMAACTLDVEVSLLCKEAEESSLSYKASEEEPATCYARDETGATGLVECETSRLRSWACIFGGVPLAMHA